MVKKVKAKGLTMLVIKILFILLGLYIIYLYIGPLISLGVINAGNLFGFAVGGSLMALGFFLTPVMDIIKTLWASGGGKAILSLLCIALVAFTALFFGTLHQVTSHARKTAEEQSVVLVLGCQIRGSLPSATLQCRSRVAAAYLKEHPNAVAIATGGQGPDEDLSEGQCIYNLMTANGIAPERIYIEDKSTNTDENIKNAKGIIDENGFSTEVAVATSEYHQYRAAMICKKNGLAAASLPSPSSKRAKPTFFTREVFGVWAQWLKRMRG